MLLKTGIDLELIHDAEILTMIEKSKRGGLTFVGSKRYANANNKHMGKENYDKTKESTYISYVDANNLYGFAMVQPLPYKNLKFETVESLPFVTEEFGELLNQSEALDDTPSCSLAEALEKQDLFINSTLAQMGSSLLWSLFRNGLIENRGFFLNLRNFQSQPIKL